ncbi:CPBP family intramembrane glutamic endopeptidase [Dyella acidiphila]|uniref:CPBP family intramembrane metalloprotease n=1 Tax=Dyella acidiphila TaxID=2775866 RepID=A0ABR9G528_9GAMM|nr:type II CAAX endopeptidase family protein [Dyella acidiphila]MBE1159136.1 CPBP family intramembrane metalloprotease [Dyella acidiphila]
MSQSIAFTTPSNAPAWQRWLVFSTLARIVIFAALLLGIGYLMHALLPMTGWTDKSAAPTLRALAHLLLELVPSVVGYLVLVKLIERRRMQEFSARSVVSAGIPAFLGGFVLFSTVVGLLWLFGSYHVLGINTQVDWLPEILVDGVAAGIAEEIVTRGVLFRAVEEGMGTWWALIISALFFGAAHIFNPGATLWSSLAIAIEAGILLALVFHVTRSLWACVGLHAAWNIAQGTIYGIPVSGTHSDGLLVSSRSGPDWLSGGGFGAEASVVALATCSLVSAALLLIALRRRSIVAPSWRRKNA